VNLLCIPLVWRLLPETRDVALESSSAPPFAVDSLGAGNHAEAKE